MSSWVTAHHAWSLAREAETAGHATEMKMYDEDHPQPTLKQFMVGLAFTHLEDTYDYEEAEAS